MSHQKLLLVEQETILLYNQAEPAAQVYAQRKDIPGIRAH